MNCKTLKRRIEKQERRLLEARIRLVKTQAELDVLKDQLDEKPSMEILDYEPIN